MKMNTLEKAYGALESMTAELVLSQEIIDKAKAPIERMLNWSRN
jgi:quinolinate synthase